MTEWEIFDSTTGFGGNGPFIEVTPEQNYLGIEDRTGGVSLLADASIAPYRTNYTCIQ
jgi:hypothetical protein